MTKNALIRAIAALQGRDASPTHLRTRSVAQLRETLARWRAVAAVTDREIRQHCDTGLLRGRP